MVTPLHEMAVGKVRASLTILLGAVGCTLLIACANLANLFLARATARHKEVAIRQALGARRSELVRQLMTESLLVCFAGGALGLLAAWWAVGVFVAGLPAAGNFRMPRHQEIAMGCAGDRFQLRRLPGHGSAVRPGAGLARLARGPELVAEGILARLHGGPFGRAHTRRAGGHGDRDGADAARRRGAAGAELPQPARSSTPGSTRITWWRSACRSPARNMRRPIAARPSIARWWRSCAPCPECGPRAPSITCRSPATSSASVWSSKAVPRRGPVTRRRRPTAWRCPATSRPSGCGSCAAAISTNATRSPPRRWR